jgi:hypothetical protein
MSVRGRVPGVCGRVARPSITSDQAERAPRSSKCAENVVVLLPPPAALVVAHPGHELRLFRWLELDRPVVFVLTDGSGRSGHSRVASSLAVLGTTGSSAGSIVGRFTDREIYEAMIAGEVDGVLRATLDLAGSLAAGGFRSVVADALEFYNPTHDLCSVMASLATVRAVRITGRAIDRYEYAVTAPADAGKTIELDDEAFARKMKHASRYEDVAIDIEELIRNVGSDGLRREVLTPIAASAMLREPASKPYYEVRGEEQVAAGRYATVLRHREHFVPFVEALSAAMSSAAIEERA